MWIDSFSLTRDTRILIPTSIPPKRTEIKITGGKESRDTIGGVYGNQLFLPLDMEDTISFKMGLSTRFWKKPE